MEVSDTLCKNSAFVRQTYNSRSRCTQFSGSVDNVGPRLRELDWKHPMTELYVVSLLVFEKFLRNTCRFQLDGL